MIRILRPISKALIVFGLTGWALAALAQSSTDSSRDRDGLTALHLAAGRGDTKEVLRLLDSGADLFTLDSKMGVSVLHKAVYSGNAETVEALLNRGALINLQSPSNGDTPLHDALYFKRGNDLSVIKTLLAHNAGTNICNRAGLIAIESAKLLHDSDAEHLIQDYELKRQSPASRSLMAAVRADKITEVRRILATEKVDLSQTDADGFAPLAWAARQGYSEIVEELLKRGANPNQNDQWMGATSGHKAAFWGRPDAMRLLVAHGLDLNARGAYNGYTALMDAVTRMHFDVAKILVDAGADLGVKGHDGLTALDIAKRNGDEKMVKLLTSKTQ